MITRVATARSGKGKPAATIEVEGKLIEIDQASLTTFDTEAKLLAEMERQAKRSLPVFFHINRDGSLAMATGAAPAVWPEDVPVDEDAEK